MKKDSKLIDVHVVSIKQATPKIKVFRLSYGCADFHFLPGQWIDLFAPIEGKNIGGYTITSSPKEQGSIELAVRESVNHPVTKFLHNEVKVGDVLKISEGQGKFFLSDELQKSPLTFIVGGIGVTPILSMVRTAYKSIAPIKVFYSVSKVEDILFKDELTPFTTFTVTKNDSKNWQGETRRIDLKFLQEYHADFNSHFFICGPKPLIDDLTRELKNFGVPGSRIHFEKWW